MIANIFGNTGIQVAAALTAARVGNGIAGHHSVLR
jgi:hypothetical protein